MPYIMKDRTDALAKALALMPGFMIKGIIGVIKGLDAMGVVPEALLKASPFHTSMYITNLGSLGMNAVYHHIYNIGTTSMFLAFGIKKNEIVYVKGQPVERKFIDLKVLADERIVDGYYFAQSFKLMMKYLENPERLLTPPEEVVIDSEI